MKQEIFKQEFNKMFKWFTNESPTSALQLELEFYKKLWNFFVIGPSYYFVMNHHNISLDFVSKEVEEVMGYTSSEFSIQLMTEILHPDDRSWFLLYGQKTAAFFSALSIEKLTKYKLRYDIRYQK